MTLLELSESYMQKDSLEPAISNSSKTGKASKNSPKIKLSDMGICLNDLDVDLNALKNERNTS